MQRTTDVHDQVANPRLPETADVVDHAAARHAAGDVLDAHAATCDASIGGFLAAREGSASWLPGWHDDLDLGERERQDAQILKQPTARGSGIGGGLGNPLVVGTTRVGRTQEEDREYGVDPQHIVHRGALFLAALTARLLRRLLGTPETPCGAIMPTRGDVGAGAAASGSDALGGSCTDTTSALASASVTPRRVASSVMDRVGVSPSARSVACRIRNRTCIHG
jgi:hypothetical protein